jgi:hypothetical protein
LLYIMQNAREGITQDPRSGKVYRITPPKQRTAQFQALESAVLAAKECQGMFMREHNLAFDGQRRITVHMGDRSPLEDGEVKAQLEGLLANTRMAQEAVKAYKREHRAEFQAVQPARGVIPTVNVPRRRGPN